MYPRDRCTVGCSSDGVNDCAWSCWNQYRVLEFHDDHLNCPHSALSQYGYSYARACRRTFFTMSSMADLISPRFALFTRVVGNGSVARDPSELGWLLASVEMTGTAVFLTISIFR